MRLLGTPGLQRSGMRRYGYDEIGMIFTDVKGGELGDGERVVQGEPWRTDERFKAVAPMYTTLYAIHLPSRGGDTQFANMYAAYDDLPEATKRRIQDLRVVHRYDSSRKCGRVVALSATEPSTLSEVAHPLVQVHPESGRKGGST